MSHTIHMPLHARVWALLAALLVTLGATVATASPAHAHDALVGSDPAAGSTVDTLPAQLTLTFSAEISDEENASVVEVTDAAGAALVAGTPTVHDNVLTQPLGGAASGAVSVLWKVVSSDGHSTSGEFSFTVQGGAAPTTAPTVAPTAAPAATPTPEPSETVLTDDMSVDWGATALAYLLPVLIGAALASVIIVAVVFARRRRQD